MPLSPPEDREPIHHRRIDCRGYRRKDGLWDIEGHLTDVKSDPFPNTFRGEIKPGEPRKGPVTRASHDWVKVNHRIWRLARQVPEADCLHVRYEDICRDPEGTMRRLFEFVGLEPHDVVSSQAGEDGASDQGHTIGGNKIRFTSEKLNISEDFRWRENLTADDLAIVRDIAGPMSNALGHEIEG